MDLTIHADTLTSAIGKLMTVIERKSNRPILSNLYIKAMHNSLNLQATDLDISLNLDIPADVSEDGQFCISAKRFHDILREMPSSDLHLTMQANETLLHLDCFDISFSLLTVSPDEFPQVIPPPSVVDFNLSSSQLLNLVNKTIHAVSTDETRPFLNGIFFQKVNKTLRSVATDGHRLALYEFQDFQFDISVLEEGILVPRKGVLELKKLCDYCANEDLKVSLNESFLYVSNAEGTHRLSVRLLAREFPEYNTIIPSQTMCSMTVGKDILLTTIRRVKTLAADKTNGIALNVNNGLLTVKATHPSLGQATESLEVIYDGKELELGLNALYLLECLQTIPEQEITFDFNNEFGPIIIRSELFPDFFEMICPLKL